MRLKAPRVPPAATAAFEAALGPRFCRDVHREDDARRQKRTPLRWCVGLDPRAKYTAEDRKLEFDAAMRVYNLLGDMSFEVARINSVRDALAERAGMLKGEEAFGKRLLELSQKTDDLRRKIVATKEGGAITGEERIREKTTEIYGDLLRTMAAQRIIRRRVSIR